MHHATIAMRVEHAPPGWTARVLFLAKPGGEVEPYAPLVAYMADNPFHSTTWQDTVARGVGLMWDFFRAHAIHAPEGRPTLRRLFRAFAIALVTGTIDPQTAQDPLGLHWPHMPRGRAVTLLRSVEDFLSWYQVEWLGRAGMDRVSALEAAIPDNALTFTDVLVWSRLRQVSALAHLKTTPVKVGRPKTYDIGRKPDGSDVKPAKAFPSDRVGDLVLTGHARSGRGPRRAELRDQMIATLCAYGGLRRSEALHLFTTDVVPHPEWPESALVVLHHPSEAPYTYVDSLGCEVTVTRREYLAREFGLLPRHVQMRGRYHVGWKGMDLDEDKQAIVHWLDELAGRAFLAMYREYGLERAAIMKRRNTFHADEPAQGRHPFLFVADGESRHAGRKSTVGDPYSAKAYERNHRAAVKRLGLPYGKMHGTTTHGLRHRYGRRLVELGMDAPTIQQSLRHRYPGSQIPYVTPPAFDNSRLLIAATDRLRSHGAPSYDLLGSESSLALYALSRHGISGGNHG